MSWRTPTVTVLRLFKERNKRRMGIGAAAPIRPVKARTHLLAGALSVPPYDDPGAQPFAATVVDTRHRVFTANVQLCLLTARETAACSAGYYDIHSDQYGVCLRHCQAWPRKHDTPCCRVLPPCVCWRWRQVLRYGRPTRDYVLCVMKPASRSLRRSRVCTV
jgi:hypothetical protein